MLSDHAVINLVDFRGNLAAVIQYPDVSLPICRDMDRKPEFIDGIVLCYPAVQS